jgi:hypothetical protein
MPTESRCRSGGAPVKRGGRHPGVVRHSISWWRPEFYAALGRGTGWPYPYVLVTSLGGAWPDRGSDYYRACTKWETIRNTI